MKHLPESTESDKAQAPPLQNIISSAAARQQTIMETSLLSPVPPLCIRRVTSTTALNQASVRSAATPTEATGRRRSTSAPQRPQNLPTSEQDLRRQATAGTYLQTVAEEHSLTSPFSAPKQPSTGTGRLRGFSNAATKAVTRRSRRSSSGSQRRAVSEEYESELVDVLDCVDPEVSTLSTLNNVQNSLFVPYLGRYYNRRPTYSLSKYPTTPLPQTDIAPSVKDEKLLETTDFPDTITQESSQGAHAVATLSDTQPLSLLLTNMSFGHNYARVPDRISLEDWSLQEKEELNDYVRHLLHSRRAKLKRKIRGFVKYVSKPVGFFVTLYAVTVTGFGLVWFLFLVHWISRGDRQRYFIEVCDQVLTALLVVIGIGLSPWRVVDTYHMSYIAYYHRLTLRLRRERAMPELPDPNDLPEVTDLEAASKQSPENTVLDPQQEKLFRYHQQKFAKRHTFYKPHETFTHHAFSVKLLITIVILLDLHSMFQMALGGTTWGIYYKVRPAGLTAGILGCSITCNILAGVLISRGGKRSRKKDVVEQMLRQDLTKDAIAKLQKRKGLHVNYLDTATSEPPRPGEFLDGKANTELKEDTDVARDVMGAGVEMKL